MEFDRLNLPKPSGATDYMDSCHLAGIMIAFKYPGSEKIDMRRYLKYNENGVLVGVRHPEEVPSNNWKNFTRDQLIPLAVGLRLQGEAGSVRKLYYAAKDRNFFAQNTEADVVGSTKKFPNGPDPLPPDVINHLRICGDLNPKFLGKLWFKASCLFNAKFTPLSEPNNMILIALMLGRDYVRFYKKTNPNWRNAISEYWFGWRGEPGLAHVMITTLEQI